MKKYSGSLLLILCAFIWGTAFVAQADAAESIPPFTFSALRSFVGAAVLLIFLLLRKKIGKNNEKTDYKKLILPGLICGIVLSIAMNLQQVGITVYPDTVNNVPGRSGVNIEAATTLRMAREIPNLVAIKEASGYLSQIKKILEATPAGFSLISGDDALTYEMLTLGAGGVISVVGNALPALFGQMVHDAMAGKVSAAKDINIKLGEIYPLLSVDGNPAGIKALLSAMHLCENRLRLPLTPARAETCTQLQTIAKTF